MIDFGWFKLVFLFLFYVCLNRQRYQTPAKVVRLSADLPLGGVGEGTEAINVKISFSVFWLKTSSKRGGCFPHPQSCSHHLSQSCWHLPPSVKCLMSGAFSTCWFTNLIRDFNSSTSGPNHSCSSKQLFSSC